MRCGLIVPIYKAGKPLGHPKSYRPVMLLSVVRKILTSILTRRHTLHVQSYVAESQAGFRPGRSTTDGVFYARTMCERALLGDWSYSSALLDFSGAFDTVIRQVALKRLATAGAPRSTTAVLVSNTTARTKLGKQLSKPFPTNIGVVQGDPMSPIMFITYAEGSMRKIREQALPASDLPATFTQYADDTTAHQNERSSVEETVRVCEPVFSDDNLKLNEAKTQYFTVTKEDDSWKSVKLLGSMLGTAEDIAARVSAANRAFASIPWKRHNLNSRLCMFSCLILPVLLYNCALWTLSQTLTDVVNVWHRKKLRTIIGITYPQRISNTALYARTEQTPLSQVCRQRRLLWFGHVVREGEESSSFQALLMSINTTDIRRPRGRPRLRWIDVVKKDLQCINLSLLDAVQSASDRAAWLEIVNRCVDLMQ